MFVSEAGARPSSPEARGLFTSWSRRVRKYNLGPEAVSEMGSETAYPSNCFSSSTSSHTIRTTMKRNKTRGRGRQCRPGTCLVRGAVIRPLPEFSHSGRGPCERLVPEGTAVGELRVQVAKKEL